MPIITSTYTPSLLFKNSYTNTLYRSFFHKENIKYQRKRVKTWDNDFIDLDFSLTSSKTLVLLTHGLEGSSNSSYITTIVKQLDINKFDTVCFNLRGCSGEDNLLLPAYHSGKTDDLNFIINYLINNYNYTNIILVGFSLGGNLTLKYLGENKHQLHSKIKGAVTISVPIDLTSAEKEMDKLKNKPYIKYFFRTMKGKILTKHKKFPEFKLDVQKLKKASKFKHLEKLYTVPVFGFHSPEDYWQKASSKPYLNKITVPTLLINAKNDTFLPKECYPYTEAKNSEFLYLETPKYGGHVGFTSSLNKQKNNWLEQRIIDFIFKNILSEN